MLVLLQGLVQVDFHLEVRRADLALISMKELAILMNVMGAVQNPIIVKDYLVSVKVILNGVMT